MRSGQNSTRLIFSKEFLTSQSGYFRELLGSDGPAKQQQVAYLEDEKLEVFAMVIQMIFCGTINSESFSDLTADNDHELRDKTLSRCLECSNWQRN